MAGDVEAGGARLVAARLYVVAQGRFTRCVRVMLALLFAAGVFGLDRDAVADEAVSSTLYVHGQIRAGEMRISPDKMHEGGVETMQTRTPFTDGESVFTGIPFARLWEMIEPTGHSIRAVAINDYFVEAPAQELIEMEAFIAFEVDGRPLKLRDKGPFWIVFPWSRRPDLYASGVYSLSVWQLVELEVR